jgi:pimeloyl-ACP methyl ester carboxylesterase
VERDMFLHKKGARQPDALNPDNWAIDAYAFSIAANRVFMSRLFMNLTTNIQYYSEWTAYLKDRKPKTLIVWGRNDPLIVPAAAEFVKQVLPAAELRCYAGGHFVLDEYVAAAFDAWYTALQAFRSVPRSSWKSFLRLGVREALQVFSIANLRFHRRHHGNYKIRNSTNEGGSGS